MSSPTNPDLYTPVRFWSPVNQGFYANYRRWLRQGGYSQSTLNIYSCVMRLAISQLDKPYWQISDADLDDVRALIAAHFPSAGTRCDYNKGLRKLAEFLRQLQGKPQPEKPINCSYFLDGLPDWLATDIRGYVRHRQRAWLPEEKRHLTDRTVGQLTLFLRWAARETSLTAAVDLTPPLWFTYLDGRLAAGMKPTTTNKELHALQSFLRYLADLGRPICERMLQVARLPCGKQLPKDVSVERLRRIAAEIETDAASDHAGLRRTGIMDRAWFLLMLHSGLRVGEVRRLRRADLDLVGQRVRIVQSKGLKDRVVFLSQATVAAIEAYLPLRGPLASDHLFVYRHRPLTVTYCSQRLRTFGKRSGLTIQPHQLRHSCATLLLNAGAPILTVQALLGHKHIDTTLTYARLYDGTVAADYYRAMATVEQQLQLTPMPEQMSANSGQLVALVDALQAGTLNAQQRELLHTLRTGLLGLSA
ncbi:MAG: tyrosine-type recombinase/integrase [Anaerolineales bacterium]|nr:tyrosine-type recombinase/integrase [Anaerolineales bacterium]